MKFTTVETIVTFAGIIFLGVSFLIILLGKKIEAESGQRQKIKFTLTGNKSIDINVTSIIMLMILFIVFTLIPLILQRIKIGPKNFISDETVKAEYISKDIVNREYQKIKDLVLNINCFVLQKENDVLKNAESVKVKAQLVDGEDLVDVFKGETDSMGNLNFCLSNIQMNKNYKITWRKDNYREFTQNLKFGNINYGVTLVK